MACANCGCDTFIPSEYRLPAGGARALECTRCRTLVLDESAATSEDERQMVRHAMAVRAAIQREREQFGAEEPTSRPAALRR